MKFYQVIGIFVLAAFLQGCRLIDEDLNDCETNFTTNYELRLVTNMDIELTTQLSMETDIEVQTALKEHFSKIFTDKAHDVDLSFYDVEAPSVRLHHESHIIDASQSSYTLYLPVRQYMHLAAANLATNSSVYLEGDELCGTASLRQQDGNVVPSHASGLFTARLPMDVKKGVDQQFDVRLFMANCASALVLDTLKSGIKDIKAYASGFATGMNLADSTYRFAYDPRVASEKVEVQGERQGLPLCFATVNFPSPEYEATKITIQTEDPFVAPSSPEALWYYYVYVYLRDGTITETKLGVKLPLRPGQMKIIKATVSPDGSVVPRAPFVGASVSLDWHEGSSWDVEM